MDEEIDGETGVDGGASSRVMSRLIEDEMRESFIDLFDERHRPTRPARCSRWAQACAQADSVRYEWLGSQCRPPLPEERDGGR